MRVDETLDTGVQLAELAAAPLARLVRRLWLTHALAVAKDRLELIPSQGKSFPVNVDGGTFMAKDSMLFEQIGKVPLIANQSPEGMA